ncbi:MAG: hypothetical protein OHK006_04720 [Thermodesulfovibrionales bacterium]
MTILFIDIIPYMKLGHGLFNSLVLLGFLIQAAMGVKIRRARLAGKAAPDTRRHHRTFGRFLAPAGILGYLAGISLVILDAGTVLKYPLHFLVGSLIVAAISVQVVTSSMIHDDAKPWRNRHYLMGRLLLFLYGFQAFIGFGVLL